MRLFDVPQYWKKETINDLQIKLVTAFMRCETQSAVEASVEFAKYLHDRGLGSDNYLLFMELMIHENHNVVDALLGDADAVDFFSKVQLNNDILSACFDLLYNYAPGGVYERSLEAILGIICKNYHSAMDGFTLHPLTIEKVNSFGKFLDKSKPQSNSLNRAILNVLGDLADLISKDGAEEHQKIAIQANKIRNVFFDRKVEMEKALPPQILIRKDYKLSSINPRSTKPLK